MEIHVYFELIQPTMDHLDFFSKFPLEYFLVLWSNSFHFL